MGCPRFALLILSLELFCSASQVGCERGQGAATATSTNSAPESVCAATQRRPEGCTEISPSSDLGTALRALPDGASVCLADGDHHGPVVITKPLHLWGTRRAVIRSQGQGTTIEVQAPFSKLEGFTIDGSGGRFDQDDAALKVHANDVTVRDISVKRAMFGILAERVERVRIEGNCVEGDAEAPLGLRGDAIRLWEAKHSVVAKNRVFHGRDVVLWYSPHNLVEDNVFEGGRYGTHLMYASQNVVRRNVYRANVVGVFVMYSREVRLEDNSFFDLSGAAGMGVGLKDSGNVTIARSRFVHNTVAVYIDNSPGERGDRDVIDQNEFASNKVAVAFHGGAERNELTRNDFLSNEAQVTVDGGSDAQAALWSENRYDDYEGYDFDGNGIGDVPYTLKSLATALSASHPKVAFFRGTFAFSVVDALGKIVPLFAPKTLLVDQRPLLSSPKEASRAR